MSKATILADWTKLPLETIRLFYIGAAVAEAKDWKTLESTVQSGGDAAAMEKDLIAKAFDEAERRNFIKELAINISRVERGLGRKDPEIAALMSQMVDGSMQLLTNPRAGLMELALLPALTDIGKASAYVESGNKLLGTAFLIAPDLVLTSAHVVLQHQGGSFLSSLKPDLKFTFMPALSSTRPVVRAARGTEPVAAALPHGSPPDSLDPTLGSSAGQLLDFAIVRLSSSVEHVSWIDITQPASAQKGVRCFVIGYPGEKSVWFDVDLVKDVNETAARVMHMTNTAAGMSGSCCVGPNGPVALHEGGFFKIGADGRVVVDEAGRRIVENNRAISLRSIRAALGAMKSDPLVARPRASGGGIHNPALVVAWHRTGLRLAGPALEQVWNTSVSQTPGVSVEAIGAKEGYHPWFKRADLETWIDGMNTNADERVAYLNGEAGTGKSFAVHILAAKINKSMRDLIVLTPTQTSAWSWSEAVAGLRRVGGGNGALRTAIGAVKFEDVAPIVSGLRTYGGIDRTAEGQHPLFVAIDFENGGNLKFEGTPWREFIKQLAAQPWIRLLLVGLTESERGTLDRIFQSERDTETLIPLQIDLEHVGAKELKEFLLAVYRDRGRPLPKATLDDFLGVWTNGPSLHETRPELKTAEAVLIALTAYNALVAAGGN
jgi:hypothetical protein